MLRVKRLVLYILSLDWKVLADILLAKLKALSQCENRKRSRNTSNLDDNTSDISYNHPKRLKTSTSPADKEKADQEASLPCHKQQVNSIDYWRRENKWPKEYFELDSTMDSVLAMRRSTPSLRRKRSDSGSLTESNASASDEKSRETKSAPYKDARYEIVLKTKGSFMHESKEGITDTSEDWCRKLLWTEQDTPKDTLFRDDLFQTTIRKIQSRNETRVIRDVSLLIVPSAENLATYGAEALDILVESNNEGWNNSIPITKTRPRPDYSVGFAYEAFTKEELTKIAPILGDIYTDMSYFMATYYMYFPFLTCEVKCGAAALDVADRQNAQSMTIAVRAIVELFRLVKREREVHREILGFSISHDDQSVRIYGHYPIIEGKTVTYYRCPIRAVNFTDLFGKEKWSTYKFTKNVYDIWMPMHFKRIRSVLDELPAEVDFSVPALSKASGLSQSLEGQILSQASPKAQSSHEPSSTSASIRQKTTPGTSFTDQGQVPKKKKITPS